MRALGRCDFNYIYYRFCLCNRTLWGGVHRMDATFLDISFKPELYMKTYMYVVDVIFRYYIFVASRFIHADFFSNLNGE